MWYFHTWNKKTFRQGTSEPRFINSLTSLAVIKGSKQSSRATPAILKGTESSVPQLQLEGTATTPLHHHRPLLSYIWNLGCVTALWVALFNQELPQPMLQHSPTLLSPAQPSPASGCAQLCRLCTHSSALTLLLFTPIIKKLQKVTLKLSLD